MNENNSRIPDIFRQVRYFQNKQQGFFTFTFNRSRV